MNMDGALGLLPVPWVVGWRPEQGCSGVVLRGWGPARSGLAIDMGWLACGEY